MYKFKSVSGKCPLTNSEHKITIKYQEISMIGKLAPGYKALNYSCSDSDECPFRICPIYEEKH